MDPMRLPDGLERPAPDRTHVSIIAAIFITWAIAVVYLLAQFGAALAVR